MSQYRRSDCARSNHSRQQHGDAPAAGVLNASPAALAQGSHGRIRPTPVARRFGWRGQWVQTAAQTRPSPQRQGIRRHSMPITPASQPAV
jgi:hypothetical protein